MFYGFMYRILCLATLLICSRNGKCVCFSLLFTVALSLEMRGQHSRRHIKDDSIRRLHMSRVEHLPFEPLLGCLCVSF